MNKDSLNAVLDAEIEKGVGYQGGTISEDRRLALQYFKGDPYGNEVEGRSSVVTREVADTIEAQLPALLKIFTASNEAVRFDPEGPEDEPAAEQESDICNYVFYKENPGFEILYTWFKDALLQKNGIVKVVWEENSRKERETYTGLDDIELSELINDEYVKPIEYTQEPDGTNSVTIIRTFPGKVAIYCIPPEEFIISKEHNSINPKTARCAVHRSRKTSSELIEMGFDRKVIEELTSSELNIANNERWERFKNEEFIDEDLSIDPSNKFFWLEEFYVRVDYNDDGVAELRQVMRVGKTILSNLEADRSPFNAITPYIMPHTFVGESSADKTMDVQLIKSTILRQVLDNMYNLNNGRFAVVDGQVNLDDLLTSRPGGIVRQKAPNMVARLDTPILGAPSFNLLEYMDTIKENRTGVTAYNQGMNADTLNKTATGINMIMDASQQRLELIARVFAETGVKQMFLDIHALLLKHQTKPKWVKLRNNWIRVSPTEWRDRFNMTTNVGLGTGNKAQTQASMNNIIAMQMQLMPLGLSTPENLFNSCKKLVDSMGFHGETFFTLPQGQQGPSAEEQQMQMQMQLEQEKLKLEQQRMQLDMQIKAQEAHMKEQELQIRAAESQARLQIESAKLADGTDADTRLKEARIKAMADVERATIDANARHYQVDAVMQQNQIKADKVEFDRQVDAAKIMQDKYNTDVNAVIKMSTEQLKADTALKKAEQDDQEDLSEQLDKLSNESESNNEPE